MISDQDLLRYSRQIILPSVDVAGQEALAVARVMLIGAGGLGCPAGLYLAGAGAGNLTLVDPDTVETSNLQRQVAFRENDTGQPKVQALSAQLQHLNSGVAINGHCLAADEHWLAEHVTQHDLVLDCSDNFATRLAVNHACRKAGVPLISAAAIRLEGQLALFDFRQADSPCYQCLYGEGDEADSFCHEAGILGPVVGMMGTFQALLAIRLLCGHSFDSQLYLFDGESLQWRTLAFRRDPECPGCGKAAK